MSFELTGFVDEADKTVDGQIGVLRELGWKAIEARLIDGRNLCDYEDTQFEKVAEKFEAADIRILGLGSSLANWARPVSGDFQKDVDELRRNLPRMKKHGIRLIRCMSYPNDSNAPWDKTAWKAEVVRRLSILARMCEDAGVTLGHENCSGYGGLGPEEFLELAEAIRCPAFKLIMDTGNQTMHYNEPETTWEYYRKARPYICHVHIKAGKLDKQGKYVTCYPNEDPVQSRILRDLKQTGYQGWLSIEPHLAAAIHAGKDVEDPTWARRVFIDYGHRIGRMVAAL